MALISSKVIAQVSCSSNSALAAMSWEWVLRADGQVLYRLTRVDGRRERNLWTLVRQSNPAQLQSFRKDRDKAAAMLDNLARQHGHKAGL
jgi:hypothetical protein